jgi:hypothetical protein
MKREKAEATELADQMTSEFDIMQGKVVKLEISEHRNHSG